ncbi:MAG TPA: ABC transporter substrate-binding protein [Chloroflexota bacterium]|nr:ABC transporter substrate-binding protein [Chloroflexota bacterium]
MAAASAAPASASATAGGTLKVGMAGDLTALEGQLIIPAGLDTVWHVFDRLSRYDDKLQPQPMLAESWDLTPDGKQITLHLRKGVQFHSGRELTSDDIKYNVQRASNPKTGVGQLAPLASWWTTVDTPDKYTVVLKSDQPRPGVFDFFEYFNIVDRDTAEGPDAKSKIAGTGPFKFVEWVTGDHLTFARNANYWQTGLPKVDQAIVQVFKDQAAMIAQLEAGAIDVADAPPVRDAVRLKADPKYQYVVDGNSGAYYLVTANATLSPSDNKLVRQAINYAIDRTRFAGTVLQGAYGTPRDLPWPANSPAADPSKNATYTFDLDKTKSLLAQGGAAGAAFNIIYTASSSAQSDLAQIMQSNLQQAGAKVTLQGLDGAAWRALTATLKGWHINITGSDYSQLLPSSLATMSAWWSYDQGQTGFKSDKYTQLVQAIGTEPDAAKRKALYGQLNDLLLDESFSMPISPNPPNVVASARVHGLAFNMHEGFDLPNASVG